jgi:hypothetical protein
MSELHFAVLIAQNGIFHALYLKAYRGSRGKLHSFSTSALDSGEWLGSRLGRLTATNETGCTLNRRLIGPQSLSRPFDEEDNHMPLPNLNSGPSSQQPNGTELCA